MREGLGDSPGGNFIGGEILRGEGLSMGDIQR